MLNNAVFPWMSLCATKAVHIVQLLLRLNLFSQVATPYHLLSDETRGVHIYTATDVSDQGVL